MLDAVFKAPRFGVTRFQASPTPTSSAGSLSPDRFERQTRVNNPLRFGGVRPRVIAFKRQVDDAGSDTEKLAVLAREFRMTIVPNAFIEYDKSVARLSEDVQRSGQATLDHDYGPFGHLEEMGMLRHLARQLGCARQSNLIKDYYTPLVMGEMRSHFPFSMQLSFLKKLAAFDPETAQAAMLQQLDMETVPVSSPGFALYGNMVETMADIARQAAPSSEETPVEIRIRQLALAQHRTLLGKPNQGADLARRINDAASFLGYADCEDIVDKYVDQMQVIYKADARKISLEDVRPLQAVCYRYGFDAAKAKLDAMGNAGLPEKTRTAAKLDLINRGAEKPATAPVTDPGMPSMVSVVDLPTMHIKQSNVGDCVLLATIDAIQRNKREGLNIIASLAKPQPDGSWIVQFHGDTLPIKIQPTDTRGEAYSRFFLFRWIQKLLSLKKKAVQAPDVVRVLERAYGRRLKAQQETVAGTINVLSRGVVVLQDEAMHAMIGPRATYQSFSKPLGLTGSPTYARDALKYIQENPEYTIAWAATRTAEDEDTKVGTARKLLSGHAYAIVDVTDTQVVLANPQDNKQLLTLTHDEFADGIKDVYTARLPKRDKSA